MTIRINFYAVDLHPFEQFLSESLGEILMFTAKNSHEDAYVAFSMNPGRYLASSRFGILDGTRVDSPDPGYIKMSTSDVESDPNLSVSCREYLATRGYTTELSLLLGALAGCLVAPWVYNLSPTVHTRWWIGSLLSWVQRTHALAADDYADYEILFLKVLRGSRCGAPLSGLQVRLSDLEFPIIPKFDNGGGRLGVWTEEEVGLFLRCTKHILSLKPQFGVLPRGRRASASASAEAEWNDWVHEMLNLLLVIEGLSYSTPNMVSTIDDG